MCPNTILLELSSFVSKCHCTKVIVLVSKRHCIGVVFVSKHHCNTAVFLCVQTSLYWSRLPLCPNAILLQLSSLCPNVIVRQLSSFVSKRHFTAVVFLVSKRHCTPVTFLCVQTSFYWSYLPCIHTSVYRSCLPLRPLAPVLSPGKHHKMNCNLGVAAVLKKDC